MSRQPAMRGFEDARYRRPPCDVNDRVDASGNRQLRRARGTRRKRHRRAFADAVTLARRSSVRLLQRSG